MQAGAAVANATNKAAGLSAATPEPGSMISAIQLVNGGRTIGPDSLTHFTESVRNKLLSLLVDMEPIQDFNGYGHPWPAGGGKNLADIRTDNATSSQRISVSGDEGDLTFETTGKYGRAGYTVPVVTGQTYTISFKASKTVSSNANSSLYVNDTAGNWDYSYGAVLISKDVSGEREYTKTITATSDTLFLGFYIGTAESYPDTVIVKDLQVELGSSKTSYSPYSNICPISGRTGLNVYAGPTSAIGDATTYSMDWTSPAGTVYAGSADIVSGDIKAAPYYASYNGETLVGPWVSSMDVYDPEGTPTTGAQVVDLGGAMTEYHITGQDIITLVGDNYIWSDSGDVTITE